MKKQLFLMGVILGMATGSYAQFSAGVIAGAGYLWERRESSGFGTLGGVDAAQPPVLAGLYGQYATRGRSGLVMAGLQLRYQGQRQSQRFAIPTGNPGNPIELSEAQYNRYRYLVATPYVGIRPFGKLEIAAGPELSLLLQSRLVTSNRNPTKGIVGYNIKATYWFGRLGLEGGYSRQITAFDSDGQQNGQTSYQFYNRYAYGAVKYNLIRSDR